jgi:hypothetical protein
MSENGPVASLAISGAAAIGPIGGNFEVGVAMNLRNGQFIGYARGGNSLGGGASAGVEIAAQKGSLNDFMGTGDVNANAKELEGSAGMIGGNLVLGGEKWLPAGGGVSAGAGIGGFLNLTSGTAVSPVGGNLYEAVGQMVRDYSQRAVAASADRSKHGLGTR